MSSNLHAYAQTERDAIYRVMAERRDMRHLLSTPIEPALLRRVLEAAQLAPSVGLSQPWRFIRITRPPLRERLYALVQEERQRQAGALGERCDEFMRLKVEAIRECGELIVAAVQEGDARRDIFGRRSLPETDVASVGCAIQNLWLATRAEGLGMGWVSMFEPAALAALLDLPASVKPIGLLCIGHVEAFYPAPMLALERWRQPRPLAELLHEDRWPASAVPQP